VEKLLIDFVIKMVEKLLRKQGKRIEISYINTKKSGSMGISIMQK